MKLPPLKYVDREEFVLRRCANKKTLHLGCAGDRILPPAEKPFHAKICEVTGELWGMDINEEG